MRSYLLQWNPINMVTTRINGVAVSTGRLKFNDLRAIIKNTPHIAFTVLLSVINNQNVDNAYSN